MLAFQIVSVLSILVAADALRLAKNTTNVTHVTHNTTNVTHVTQNITNATHLAKKHNLTAEEQLMNVAASLKTIQSLQSLFTSEGKQSASGMSGMASGAMTAEMTNKDSTVWATIAAMVNASQKAQTAMKGKNKTEADKVMQSLEDELDSNAVALKNVSDKATEVDANHSAEYVLGLLNTHQKEWSIEKQLNVTRSFENGSFAVWELSKKHDMSKPFAPQLAAIMDGEKRSLLNSSKELLKKNATKVNSTKSVAKIAAKQFIQLVASLSEMHA